ncbi:MAG: hypothetical protein EON60_13555 [Alphaproteobacteria bacterium]|nr:MAG: hypothetical protein EON60_13555 [Alphaproteobacteria bacterium]
MKFVNILVGVAAVGFVVFVSLWMAVGVWPREWVERRAEWGDRLAIEEMFKRTIREGDMDIHSYWARKNGDITERDILFMEPSSRKIMKKLFEAQGKDTPLLDIVDKN